MKRPYMPSNGTDGMIFQGRFCDRCKKDSGEGCKILLNALIGEQPAEWVMDEGDFTSGRCEAFEAGVVEEKAGVKEDE